MTAPDPTPAEAKPAASPAGKPTLKERLAKLFAEYGTVAVYLYFGLSIATITGFAIAFWFGIEPTDATGVFGVLGAAWLAGKSTIFIRVPIVLAITPPIAELLKRRRARRIAAGLELSDEQLAALEAEEAKAARPAKPAKPD